MFSDICQWKECGKKATRIAAKPEGGIIDICDDCWHEHYRS
jgi:ribosome-binding protein aMBF1 (putative translation factor)